MKIYSYLFNNLKITDKGEKEKFIGVWKELEEISEKVFHPISGTPMDELFTNTVNSLILTKPVLEVKAAVNPFAI